MINRLTTHSHPPFSPPQFITLVALTVVASVSQAQANSVVADEVTILSPHEGQTIAPGTSVPLQMLSGCVGGFSPWRSSNPTDVIALDPQNPCKGTLTVGEAGKRTISARHLYQSDKVNIEVTPNNGAPPAQPGAFDPHYKLRAGNHQCWAYVGMAYLRQFDVKIENPDTYAMSGVQGKYNIDASTHTIHFTSGPLPDGGWHSGSANLTTAKTAVSFTAKADNQVAKVYCYHEADL